MLTPTQDIPLISCNSPDGIRYIARAQYRLAKEKTYPGISATRAIDGLTSAISDLPSVCVAEEDLEPLCQLVERNDGVYSASLGSASILPALAKEALGSGHLSHELGEEIKLAFLRLRALAEVVADLSTWLTENLCGGNPGKVARHPLTPLAGVKRVVSILMLDSLADALGRPEIANLKRREDGVYEIAFSLGHMSDFKCDAWAKLQTKRWCTDWPQNARHFIKIAAEDAEFAGRKGKSSAV